MVGGAPHLEKLSIEIARLESDIERLQEELRLSAATESTRLARAQARIILQGFFDPFLDGICSALDVSPEEALQILIEEKTDFGKIAKNNPQDLAKMLSDPMFKVALGAAKQLGAVSDEWIKEKMNVLLEVMGDIRPALIRSIIETPGGIEWFYKSLTGLRDILFEAKNEVSDLQPQSPPR